MLCDVVVSLFCCQDFVDIIIACCFVVLTSHCSCLWSCHGFFHNRISGDGTMMLMGKMSIVLFFSCCLDVVIVVDSMCLSLFVLCSCFVTQLFLQMYLATYLD